MVGTPQSLITWPIADYSQIGNPLDTRVLVCAAFAICVDFVYLLWFLNELHLTFPKRRLDPQIDVIAITGGSSGLGRLLVAMLANKGYKTINIDVNEPEFLLPNVAFYKCDISNPQSVKQLRDQIKKDIGPVTVLINNAAVAAMGSLLDLTESAITNSVNVNLLGPFWTVRAFLPDMIELKRGFIVDVGSTLGYVGAANLSAYSATKGGVTLFHDCMAHEVEKYGIKSLLVSPGQLSTNMFSRVKTPSDFLAPVLSPVEVACEIVDAVEQGRGGELRLPTYAKLIKLFRALPHFINDLYRKVYNLDDTVDKELYVHAESKP
jgi:short-subunit dehydrogenase